MNGRAQRMGTPIPVVLALAGLEPTGRVGLLADVEAIRAAGGAPRGIATALTAQGGQTFSVAAVPLAVLRSQLMAIAELDAVLAVKMGMLAEPAVLRLVQKRVRCQGPWVIDPVTRTSRGQRLSTLRPADYLKAAAPNAVLTPNLAEAAWLLGQRAPARGVEEMARAAERLHSHGFAAVIVKGGHLAGLPVDVLVDSAGSRLLKGSRIHVSVAPRGTGCRFASVLATALARGESMADAARLAKTHVRAYLLSAGESGGRLDRTA